MISSPIGDIVTVTFTAFDVEDNYDALYVYDGPDATSPIISSGNPETNSGFPAGGYYGTSIPGPFTSTHPSGALTFVFMSDGVVSNPGWEADITCAPPPTCPAPSDLMATSITETTATLGWTENGTATSWDIELGLDGFAPTGTPTETGVSNPYPATNLDPGTDYEYYVRATCGPGDLSTWSGPYEFTTLCTPVYTPDYLEDFSNVTPNCWEEANEGLPAEGPIAIGSGPWFDDEFLNTGNNLSASIYIYDENQLGWLISPEIDLSGGSYELTYVAAITDYFNSNPPEGEGMGSDDEIKVLITADGGTTWEPLMTYNQSNIPSVTGDVEILSLAGYNTTVKIAFWANSGETDDPEAYDVFIDDFEVRTATVSCAGPLNLMVTNIGSTSVDLNWDEVPNAGSGYEWFVFTAGADPTTDSPIATGTTDPGTTTVTVDELTPETDYDFYVVANCGATDGESVLTGPIAFTTETLGIENAALENFSFYPNPVESTLTLNATNKIEQVVIYDMQGQEIMKIQPDKLNLNLKLNTLQSGTYFLKVNIEGSVGVYRIIKE